MNIEPAAGIGKYILVALFASVKFLFSPFFAEGLHLNFLESVISTTIGGIFGILAFGFVGEVISDSWKSMIAFFLPIFTKKSKVQAIKHANRKFKWMNRFIVKVKHRLGLFGLAFLSPCLISIPLGAIACMSFFSHRRKEAFLYLFISLAFWSIVLNTGAYFFKLSHLFS
jgi:hypothetical protein